MEAALRGIRGKLTEHREKVVSALLLGSFLALGWRSVEQQREIEGLEGGALLPRRRALLPHLRLPPPPHLRRGGGRTARRAQAARWVPQARCGDVMVFFFSTRA